MKGKLHFLIPLLLSVSTDLLNLTNHPRCQFATLVDLIAERLKHTSWVVVFKGLILSHNLMSLGNEVLLHYITHCSTARLTPQTYIEITCTHVVGLKISHHGSSRRQDVHAFMHVCSLYLHVFCTGAMEGIGREREREIRGTLAYPYY